MLPTTLLANGEDVEVPAECHHIHHEGELVVIIGRRTPRFLSVDEAARYVFGVTVGNDIADQTWYREQDGVDAPSRLLSKAPDTWAPLGSEIVSGIDYNDLALEARLNGQLAIQARTSEMNNSVAETISYLTEYITLEPGDVIFMGTPTPNTSRVPGSGVRGRGSGERETTASSLAGKEESSRKEDNGGQGKDGPAGAIAQGGNGR